MRSRRRSRPDRRNYRSCPEALEGRQLLATFSVTNVDDSGPGSLRQAILDANEGPDPNRVEFAIPGDDVHVITLASTLPPIMNPLVIDGYTQPGASPNTQAIGDDAVLKIVLEGSLAGAKVGLSVAALNCGVRGLAIRKFSEAAISVSSDRAVIAGNFLGVNPDGATAGVNVEGIRLDHATNGTIGGTSAADRNLISGNRVGVVLDVATGYRIQGNYIGLDATGTKALGNLEEGIESLANSRRNTIGGEAAGAGNVISANGSGGVGYSNVLLSGGEANVVSGNLLGTGADGTTLFQNFSWGIFLEAGETHSTIGGTAAGAGNLISGNGRAGVDLDGASTSANVIAGNRIGTDAAGQIRLPNAVGGIVIALGASDNTIGGTTEGARNIISGNHESGIALGGEGTSRNVVIGNYVGTDALGSRPLDNDWGGVVIYRAADNTIGGVAAGAGNLVSGNSAGLYNAGISLVGPGTTRNLVAGNFVGTDASGENPLGNVDYGINLSGGASGNTIGGTTAGARNVLSANGNQSREDGAGLVLTGAGTSGNLVLGNRIGTDVRGLSALDNFGHGVDLSDGATANTIGGSTAGAGNLIAANDRSGVAIYDPGTSGNVVLGNDLGVVVEGAGYLGNGESGVHIARGASGNTIGGTTPGSENRLVYNGTIEPGSAGVEIDADGGADPQRNAVLSNHILTLSGAPLIDLGDGRPTFDLGDADTGPNGLQNSPELLSADVGLGLTAIRGRLQSTPNARFLVQVFATFSFGDRIVDQYPVGAAIVLTGPDGSGILSLTLPFELPRDGGLCRTTLMATATDAAGNTSEYSFPQGLRILTAGLVAFDRAASDVGERDGVATFFVVRSGGPDGQSAAYTTQDIQARAGVNYVATSGVLTFGPDEVVKTITVPLLDDGQFHGATAFRLVLSDARGGAVIRPILATTIAIVREGDPPPPVTPHPVQVVPRKGLVSAITLPFDGSLDAASATARSAYVLVTPGRDGKLGTRDDQRVALRAAAYDPATNTVTLAPKGRLPLPSPARLKITGLRDFLGRPIDGDHDGQPGGPLVVTLRRKVQMARIPHR